MLRHTELIASCKKTWIGKVTQSEVFWLILFSLVINNFSYIKDKVIFKPRSKTGMIPGYFLNMWKQRYKIYYFYSYF